MGKVCLHVYEPEATLVHEAAPMSGCYSEEESHLHRAQFLITLWGWFLDSHTYKAATHTDLNLTLMKTKVGKGSRQKIIAQIETPKRDIIFVTKVLSYVCL
jgi:hypothetical protein